MTKLSRQNDWLWNSRWTHWWLRSVSPVAGNESCMEPAFPGTLNDAEITRGVRALQRAGVNAVLTDGIRHLIRFEHEGLTEPVMEAIRRAAQACHRAGIRIVHHTTAAFAGFRLTDFPESRREWLNIDGQTGTYAFLKWKGDWSGDGWYLWCINNPDFRAEYFRLGRKVLAGTGVDGFMVDEVYFRTGWHNCVCPHCLAKFRAQTGFTPPPAGEKSFWGRLDNPDFRTWLRFRSASVGDFYRDLAAALRKECPHPVLLGCHNDEESPAVTQRYGDSNDERMRGMNMLFLETGGASILYSWRRLSAMYMLYNGLTNRYGTPTLATVANPNPRELFINWALRSAHNMRIWATTVGGLTFSGQLQNVPAEVAQFGKLFAWEKKHERELAGAIRPVANIALLFSAATRDMSDHKDGQLACGYNYYVRELIGWCEALTDEYLQYAVIADTDLTEARLRPYKLVILPNAACLSDAAGRALDRYVATGGSVILTHETGWKDETGAPRVGPKPTAEGTGVRFEKRGQGKWVYFAHRPGMAVYTTACALGKPRRRDTADVPDVPVAEQNLQRSLMIQAVRWALDRPVPAVVQAPAGLVIKVFHQTRRGRKAIVVHLLNCRGESEIKLGEVIPENHAVNFPVLDDDVVLELPLAAVKTAYLISPDWPGRKTARVLRASDGCQIRIPARYLKRYAALYAST
ncbi:MAG: beta-galactosidase trimerization domain-containing protein [Kiritimatiellae bacterium]|nr:beta-galactosidase trimerization domain-containing protein [Kiritimatiellia bacterium]